MKDNNEYLRSEGDVIETKDRKLLKMSESSHGFTIPKNWLQRIAVSLECEVEELDPGFYFVKPSDSGFWDSFILIKFNRRRET